jgi:AsmA family/AsmA-like C-terminal region
MADSAGSGQNRRTWLRAVLAAGAVLLLALVLPPLVSVNHYKARITDLISRSLGRPVRLSSVEMRLLPWPGFVLYDLNVAEDPAYGAEPVLHANKVTASIRLFSLWRGRVEIGSISVDEASLNVVRAGPGLWNLDPLFRTAAAQAGPRSGAASPVGLPTLEATDSRIDFKNGAEKLPFSLVNADLTVWQANPGEWRVRLRGQPARTDVSLYLEDTGEVRMEASVRRGPALREMPLHLDLDWREAQFGQLARLVTGSDSGWRGDLTGEMHVDGTADAAHVAMRLRAAGVHREEFVPVSPLDFDANCNFLYHYTARSLENLVCDSPLGDGRIHLTGEKPSADAPPHLAVELTRIPVGAILDALRTLRSGLEPDLEAEGFVSGKIVYAEHNAATAPASKTSGRHPQKNAPVESGPLTGSLTVTNLVLTGGGLTRPIQSPRIVLTPVPAPLLAGVTPSHVPPRSSPSPAPPANASTNDALAGTVAIPAGGAIPLTFALRFSTSGYEIAVHGQAAIPRAREIAHAAGIPATAALESLAGDAIAVDLVAAGAWIPPQEILFSEPAPPGSAEPAPLPLTAPPGSDSLTGTVTLHDVNWKADYLASHLTISEATLHLDPGALRWDPIVFVYGPVKGAATLTLPESCTLQPGTLCPAQPAPAFSLAFADLDAASLETALLGARTPGTLLSTLIDRLHPSTAPPWPHAQGTVTADSLDLGPVTLEKISAGLEIRPDGADLSSFSADLLGGRVQLTGTLDKPATDQDKPSYSFTGDFQDVDARSLGEFIGLRWMGSPVNGSGNVDLAGYTGADLAASAKGSLHIEARYGSIDSRTGAAARAQSDEEPDGIKAPDALAHFDRLTADAAIADGAVTLGPNQFVSAGRKRSVAASVTLADPPDVSFEASKPSVAKR